MKTMVFRTLLALGLAFSIVSGNFEAPREAKAAAPDPRVEMHYNAGVALAKKAVTKEDWEAACNEFEKAYKLEKNPQIAANLGHAELKSGHMRSAAEHLEYFLRVEKEASKEARKEIESLLEQAKKHIVTITIDVDQPGADVVVDNVVRGKSPWKIPLFLEKGEHTFEVRKDGMKAEKQTLELDRNEKREIRFVMVADAGVKMQLPTEQRVRGSDATNWKHPLFISGIGIGVIGVGIGVGFTAGFLKKNSDAKTAFDNRAAELKPGEQMCYPNFATDPRCSRLNEATTTRNTFVKAAVASYAVGLVGLTGLVVWKLTKTKRNSDNHATLQLMVTPCEFTVKGAF